MSFKKAIRIVRRYVRDGVEREAVSVHYYDSSGTRGSFNS